MTRDLSPPLNASPRFAGVALLAAVLPLLAALLLAAGCAVDDDTSSNSHPGDAALKDPMGYKVNVPSVSGGASNPEYGDKTPTKDKSNGK